MILSQREEFNYEITRIKPDEKRLLSIIPAMRILKLCPQKTPAHHLNVWDHTMLVMENTPPILDARITAFFHDSGKAQEGVRKRIDGVDHFWGHPRISVEFTRPILHGLGYEQLRIYNWLKIITYHDEKVEISKAGILNLINKVGKENIEIWMMLKEGDILGHSPSYIEKNMPLMNAMKLECNQLLYGSNQHLYERLG